MPLSTRLRRKTEPMKLLSVNIGELRSIPGSRSKSRTGIFKEPVQGALEVTPEGLVGDHIGSKKYHGGPDQAVYIYSAEDYRWWEKALGRDLPPGTFGENLTVSTLGQLPPRIGDVWQISGGVTLELSAPRIPCSTLAARMNESKFVRMFAKANRGGAYARVLSVGTLRAGLPIAVTETNLDYPTIDQLFAEWHRRRKDPELLRRALASPLAATARSAVEKWLAQTIRTP